MDSSRMSGGGSTYVREGMCQSMHGPGCALAWKLKAQLPGRATNLAQYLVVLGAWYSWE